jgi:hypothetical protein
MLATRSRFAINRVSRVTYLAVAFEQNRAGLRQTGVSGLCYELRGFFIREAT